MCEFQWTALAEFYLCNKDFPDEIYCLCSRVFTWAGDDVNDDVSASEDNVLKQANDNPTENSHDDAHESDTVRYCTKGEPVSCYCSASHTDNISTDEHDSLRDSHASNQQVASKTLQLSDSGADLTADVSCSNSAWQKYWALNGERLIWESWIAKYSAYINPEYLQTNQVQSEENFKDLSNAELPNPDKAEGSNSLKFSFDSLSPCQDSNDYSTALGLSISLLQVRENAEPKPANEIVEKNRMLVRNLSYSDSYDKLNREIEGWNPLSPVSNDCETEAERLLSSRCASRTGSSARTVDSMTNVTRLTVSSFDLSESSKNSDSFSSVSSIQSSITSTSSEDADEPTDYEYQWNALWSKHYEQEYLEHYKKFVWESVGKTTESTDEAAESINDCDVEDNFKAFETLKTIETLRATIDFDEETSESSNKEILPVTSKSRRRRSKQKNKEKKVANSMGQLLKNLNKIEETPVQEETSHKCDMEIDIPTNLSTVDTVERELPEQQKMEENLIKQQCNRSVESECSLDTPEKEEVGDKNSSDNKSNMEVDLSSNTPNMGDTAESQTEEQKERIDLSKMIQIADKTNDNVKSEINIDWSTKYSNINNIAQNKPEEQEATTSMKCDHLLNLPEVENTNEGINDGSKPGTEVLSSNSVIPSDVIEKQSIENIDSVEEKEDAAMRSMGIPLSFGHQKKRPVQQQVNVEVEYVHSVGEEEAAMCAMGIPLSFEHKKPELPIKKPNLSSTKKRSFSLEEDDLDQSSSNRVKAAFNLLGIEMHEGPEKKFKGSFEYKMKHIRSQNRRLQFRNEKRKQAIATPKHIHFDDDGEVISDISGSNEVTVQNSHQDELSGIIPSSSTENELELALDEVKTQENEKFGEIISKKRKRKRKINLPLEIRENPKLKKFWHRRYSLFSKFDHGIKLDEESWFSVSPELVAQHTAKRCQCDIIIDAFCGAGGNSIQFALTCKKVIAIDIDPKKIELAQHNAQVYGVADRIEFIVGDFFQLADSLQANIVFLSPPWGGPQYRTLPSYDLELLQPAPFSKLFSVAVKISQNVVLFLPKNSNTYPLVTAASPGGQMEIEQNFLGKRLIAITAYYGELIKEVSVQKNLKEAN